MLLAGAGGLAVLATAGIRNYTAVEGATSNSGPVLAMVTGLVLAGAGVYALLRPAPPPGPR